MGGDNKHLVVPVVRMSLSSQEVVRVGFVGGAVYVDGLVQGVGGPGAVAVSVTSPPIGILCWPFLPAVLLAAIICGPSGAPGVHLLSQTSALVKSPSQLFQESLAGAVLPV